MGRRLGVLALGAALVAGAALAQGADTLSLRGRLDPAVRYRLRIDYVTKTNHSACQVDDDITGMPIPRVDSRFESPRLTGERHEISLTLSRLGTMTACDWRPRVVFACVGPRAAADAALNCRILFMITPVGVAAPQRLSLTCDPTTWVCVDPQGRDPARQVQGFTGPIEVDFATGVLRPGR